MAELNTRSYDTVAYEAAIYEKGEAYLRDVLVPAFSVTANNDSVAVLERRRMRRRGDEGSRY
jgi:hypothetical protein